jgi:hypothetical protein
MSRRKIDLVLSRARRLWSFSYRDSEHLTIDTASSASPVFIVTSDFTLQAKAKSELVGGIKAKSIAYVVEGDTIVGSISSFAGTVLDPTGNCMAERKAKLLGAIICQNSVTFGARVKMTFAPLTSTFP